MIVRKYRIHVEGMRESRDFSKTFEIPRDVLYPITDEETNKLTEDFERVDVLSIDEVTIETKRVR